jgi:WD40 repeat protein
MESNKNIIIKPHEIYNKYSWKSNNDFFNYAISNNLTSNMKKGLFLRFLWKQFIKWILEKDLLIGDDNNTKIFWLDTILSYLCYEFPCIASIEEHNNPINSIILMDSNIIVSGDDEGMMLVNDLSQEDNQCIRKLKSELSDSIQNIVKIDNTNIISESVDENGYIKHLLWDVSKNNYSYLPSSHGVSKNNKSIFNNDHIYTRINEKLINWKIYRVNDYNARFRVFLNQYRLNKYGRENSRKIRKHENICIFRRKSSHLPKDKICFLKLDTNIIIIGNNTILEIWDIREDNINSLMRSLSGHKKKINGCIRLGRNKIASYDEDNKIYVWNLKKTDREACINILEGHSKKITSLLTINKNIFISSSADKTIRIWNLKLKGQECVKILNGHTGSVNTIVQLDYHIIISGGSDNKLLIWDLKKFI